MAKHSLTSLFSSRLGNHRTRKDLLGVASFPGLSIDAVPSTPSVFGYSAAAPSGSGAASASGSVDQQVAGLATQLSALKEVQQSQVDQIIENTKALQASTTSRASGTSTGSTAGSVASSLFGNVFGLGSIFEGLFGLFGGGSSTHTQPAPTPFSLPLSIQYAAGINGPNGGAVPVDYGQGGQVRPIQSQSAPAGGASGSAGSTVQINVNAMDSQSFLDRSDDIASAVKVALLNSHSLNDVIAGI